MMIRFACRNGHLLKADERHVGRRTRCPRCRVSVVVPKRRTPNPVTDSQAARLVGAYAPTAGAVAPPATSRRERTCPKCRSLVSSVVRVCPYCQIYLGGLGQ